MAKRLFLVYNSHSTHHEAIEREVLAPLRTLKGWLVGKYAVESHSWQENVVRFAKILSDGDLVIVAGGDGTAAMAINAILSSGKKVVFSVLGYGNFNDVAEMLRTLNLTKNKKSGITEIIARFERGSVCEIWPLEVMVDGKHWRYALCYLTAGMMAEATAVFESPKIRRKLMTGRRGLIFSMFLLAGWYFRHLGQRFLPSFKLNGAATKKKTSDYLAVNSPRVAKIMRSKDYSRGQLDFASGTARLGGIFAILGFMLGSIFKQMPLTDTKKDVLEFSSDDRHRKITLQTEGESEVFDDIHQIQVAKSKKSLYIVQI